MSDAEEFLRGVDLSTCTGRAPEGTHKDLALEDDALEDALAALVRSKNG